ncbi:GNAT family N-acetyltransferase [Aporhodopirellula aestuarii]|uniref:GNAT family N-acetyltransferase n=1 Tax=Aporhodopirellula aestuarii TaxID=2950107 RepID=A0ABT0U4T5_9BACT|nr:GNAT family N-acetyltransferase [Aporhodopirellula aestuarii]MCM2371944.1 GNAT family N-acetyltransferase [Aporhodopirellula aestuarii]
MSFLGSDDWLKVLDSPMITVRAAAESDLPLLEKIYLDSLENAEWLPRMRPELRDFKSVTEGELIFVAVDDDLGVAGFVSIWRPDSFVHHLYVARTMQRRGVGTALLQSLDSWLPRPWTLKCNCKNTSALAFYESLGWTIAEQGESEDGLYLFLKLSNR